MLELCKISACPNTTLGLHLSRAPWDPYPWVSGVQEGSSAYGSGIRTGDTILELNGVDVLGQKISQLASAIHKHWDDGGNYVEFLIWRNNKIEQNSINQQSLQKFATCLQNIAQLLECPICLEVVKPPGWQCCNGHVLCNSCRGRTVKCPICRVTLGPRGRCLLSDKLFTLLAETFPCDVKGDSNNSNKITSNRCYDRKTNTTTPITCPQGIKKDKQIINIKTDLKYENIQRPPYSPQNESCTMSSHNKNYHCPTGKSSCGKENDESCKIYNQWDILTHLRRVHQISVIQYCGTYGELMQVELMNKSIPCISIAPDRLPTNGIPMLPPPSSPKNVTYVQTAEGKIYQLSTISEGSRVDVSSCKRISGNGFTDASSTHSKKVFHEVELFFIARIPIDRDSKDGDITKNFTTIHSNTNKSRDENVIIPFGNEKCAIFIWYCGSEVNVKKFQAVIECSRTGNKWTGFIHPMTKSWNSVRRQKEFLQFNYDVSNFFNIMIRMK